MDYDEYVQIVNYCEGNPKVALDDLANKLSISKKELTKKIQTLIQSGCLFKQHNNEYISLRDAPDLYNKNVILSQISSKELASEIILLILVDSTNTYLKSTLFNNDFPTICIAEKQTKGRGRRGKVWHSPFGSSIIFSIRKKLAIDAQISGCVSLIVGLSLVSGLNKLGYCDLKIKWPNDIYVNHKKLAGILIETVAIKHDYIDFIIGIGINVNLPVSFSANIDQPWINLSEIETSFHHNRNIIISTIVNELTVNLEVFQKSGLTPFISDWCKHDYLYDRLIWLKQGSVQTNGIAKGINDIGELLMEQESELITINAGEVSVRLTDS